MAFVNEREGIKDTKKWRTVDYERKLVLRNPGRSLHNYTESFELDIGDQTVKFATRIRKEIHEDQTTTCHYQIDAIGIPDSLKDRNDETKRYIAEALDAFGYLYRRDNIRDVKVTIRPGLQKRFKSIGVP